MAVIFESKHRLGSDCTIYLVGEGPKHLAKLSAQLWQQVDHFEARFSRFLADSELSRVNSRHGQRTAVSKEFIDLLKASLEMNRFSRGMFNPLILPALQSAGYKYSFDNTKINKDLDYSLRQVGDTGDIEIEPDEVLIPHKTALDFGGIGKGYLIDQLASFLKDKKSVYGFWISLGGDIYAKGVDNHAKSWQVAIQSAHEPETDIAVLDIPKRGLAVASSGTTKRRGKNWHHLIDPRTKQPAKTDLLMATVAHKSCMLADICASWSVIVGASTAVTNLHKVKARAYLLQGATPEDVHLSSQKSLRLVQ